MKSRYLYLASLLLLLVASSCTKDWRGDSPDDKPDQNSQIVLHIKTPAGFSSGAASRSLTVDDERAIKDIWVLAFNAADMLTEIRQGENLKDIDAKTRSFTATLQRSKDASDTYKLMVLANAEDIIKNTIGTDIEAIKDKNYTTIAALLSEMIGSKMYPAATGETIPMWGESGQLEIKLGVNNNITLSLLRAVARIDIGVGAPSHQTDGTYTWTGKDDKDNPIPFELKEVYIMKANDRYAVVPSSANMTEEKATAPTTPTDTTPFTVEQSIAKFKYEAPEITAPIGGNGSYTTQSIYIPEADVKQGEAAKSGDENHEKRMAVIVGGDYNSSGKTTYYRLDFAKQGNILDALRNHLYQFNISKVSGFGYADVETAYRSLSMNMQVDILDWDEADMGDVIFDGQNYFSISKSKVEFSPMGDESETVTIKTNVKSFELWEQRDGGEYSEIQLGGTTTYKNEDKGYVYTLTTVEAGAVYNLKIEATKHNVSNTVPDRLDKWRIKANRLNARFEVDQQYTVLYVSYVNGQSQNLYPEGTQANTISIDIMALKPVTITAMEGGATATWIDLGDISGLTTDKSGLYTAKLEIKIDPYAFEENASAIRTGAITVTPQGENPRVFTINQESPVFKFAKTNETVTRKTGTSYHTYVDIITNLQEVDYQISDIASTDADAWRITRKANLYLVDKTNPRSRRFDVDVDMATKLPLSAEAFAQSFTATINDDYGVTTPPVIKFEVLSGSNHFDWFWFDAIVPPVDVPYTFPVDDNSVEYIFPWQTKSAVFRFNTNLGLEYDPINTANKPEKGVLNKETNIPNGDKDYDITPYTFTFNKALNNVTDNYDLYFKSTVEGTSFTKNVKMGLGVQMWKRNPASAAVGVSYKGYTEAAPYQLNVTSNVDWEAVVTSADASFIKMRPSATAAFISPPMRTDDRVTTPEVTKAYNAETNLVKTAAMGVAIAPYNTLNATPASREVKMQFINQSLNASSSGIPNTNGAIIDDPVLTVTQYAPVLEHVSGAPVNTIPYYGGTYTVKVNTNIQSWGVKVFIGNDKTGTLLTSKAFGSDIFISDKAPTERSVTITLPRTPLKLENRNITFYLYHTNSDLSIQDIKLPTQIQAWVDYVVIDGLKWKMGNLVATGSNSCDVGLPGDNGLFFQFGSLIGHKGGKDGTGAGVTPSAYNNKNWNGVANYSSNDIAVTPIGYTSSRDYWPGTHWFAVQYGYYYGKGSYGSNFQERSDGTNVSLGIGDPCRQYLGSPWRLPTANEYTLLTRSGTVDSFEWVPYTQASVKGKYVNQESTIGNISGAWFGPNSRNGTPSPSTDLFLSPTGNGYRSPQYSIINQIFYMTSTFGTDDSRLVTVIDDQGFSVKREQSKMNGGAVRCVSN